MLIHNPGNRVFRQMWLREYPRPIYCRAALAGRVSSLWLPDAVDTGADLPSAAREYFLNQLIM